MRAFLWLEWKHTIREGNGRQLHAKRLETKVALIHRQAVFDLAVAGNIAFVVACRGCKE